MIIATIIRYIVPVAIIVAITQPAYAVNYGEMVGKGEFPAVGQVFISVNGKIVSYGTGTLIAPDIVQTAAHVIETANTPKAIRFELASSGFSSVGLAYRIHPDYMGLNSARNRIALMLKLGDGINIDNTTKQASQSDIALVRLAHRIPSTIQFPAIATKPLDVGAVVTAVGFGRDETKKNTYNRLLKGQLKLHTSKAGWMHFTSDDSRIQMVDKGDSGGPLFLALKNSLELCGTSQSLPLVGNLDSVPSDSYANFVSIAHHQKWITKCQNELSVKHSSQNGLVYLVRSEFEYVHPALTFRQFSAFRSINTSPEWVSGEAIKRGICDPLTKEQANSLVDSFKIPAGRFIPVSVK